MSGHLIPALPCTLMAMKVLAALLSVAVAACYAKPPGSAESPTGTVASPSASKLYSGRVVKGRVTAAGKPLRYFGVIVTSNFSHSWQAPPVRIRAKDGRFAIDKLDAGTYDVVILAKGFGRAIVPNVSLGAELGETDVGDIALGEGFTIRGRVIDTAGGAVGGADVLIQQGIHASTDDDLDALSKGNFTAVSDDNGTYQIDGFFVKDIASHSVKLTASHPKFGNATVYIGAESRTVNLVLGPTGTIEGEVIGNEHHLVVMIRSVTATRHSDTVLVGSNGEFRLAPIPVGEYEVRLVTQELKSVAPPQSVRVEAGQVTGVTFRTGAP